MGWSLRRIQCETQVRREIPAAYLKAAGIAIREPGGWGRLESSKPAIEVTTDYDASPRRWKRGPACNAVRGVPRQASPSPTGN